MKIPPAGLINIISLTHHVLLRALGKNGPSEPNVYCPFSNMRNLISPGLHLIMWVVLLFIIGFVLYHFIPESDPSKPSPRFRREPRAVESDPNWCRFIEEHCESPAETAFLHAMISAYNLKPINGALKGEALHLDFQVEEGRYRVDFLANRWLIIEIDGATYHSSPEAKARDKERDDYLEGLGYSVLRIPARTVFKTPQTAIHEVSAALVAGKRAMPPRKPNEGWRRLSESLSAFGDGITKINDHVARQNALRDAKEAFDLERTLIDAAFEQAKAEKEDAEWLARQEPAFLQEYHKSYERIKASVENLRSQTGNTRQPKPSRIVLEPFPSAPLSNKNPELEKEIQNDYARLVEERNKYLIEKSYELKNDANLALSVEVTLKRSDNEEIFRLIY